MVLYPAIFILRTELQSEYLLSVEEAKDGRQLLMPICYSFQFFFGKVLFIIVYS